MHTSLPKPIADVTADFHANLQPMAEKTWRPHIDRFVAYSLDGRQILASGNSEDEVEAFLITSGIDPAQVVVGYVDDPDTQYMDTFI